MHKNALETLQKYTQPESGTVGKPIVEQRFVVLSQRPIETLTATPITISKGRWKKPKNEPKEPTEALAQNFPWFHGEVAADG